MRNIARTLLSFAFAFVLASAAACGDDNKQEQGDGGVPFQCVENPDPNDHVQIINACTDPTVVGIRKEPNLPLLNPDGTRPPLP